MATTTILRALTRPRKSEIPRVVLSPPLPPLRSYSSSLRPPTALLTHTTIRPHLERSKHATHIHHHHAQKRSISFSSIIDTAVVSSQHLLSVIHTTTGTPWYISIPLFSLFFTLLRLPTNIWTANYHRTMAKLTPLFRASIASHQTFLSRILPHRGELGPLKAVNAQMAKQKAMLKDMRREWGVQQWKVWVATLLPFPLWLLGIEAIRKHCGGPSGLLSAASWIFRSSPPAAEATNTTAAAAADGMAAEAHAVDGAVAASTAESTTTMGATQIQDVIPQAVDPSLTTEGFLWFTDLTAADPYSVLPFALSAAFILRMKPWERESREIIFGTRKKGEIPHHPRSLVVARRLSFLFSLVIGPVTMHLPAALHLYWLSSLIWGRLQQDGVSYVMHRIEPPKQVPHYPKGEDALIIRPTRKTPVAKSP